MWNICFFVALAIFLGSVVCAILQWAGVINRRRLLTPFTLLFVGVILSSLMLFIPLYVNALGDSVCGPVETVLVAVHNMIRLFVVDGEFSFILDNMAGIPGWMVPCYTLFFALLFVFAPLLTFGAVLSFFSNLSEGRRYFFNRNKNLSIFSHLNERSLALAESLSESEKKRFLIFTSVSEDEDGGNAVFLCDLAARLGDLLHHSTVFSLSSDALAAPYRKRSHGDCKIAAIHAELRDQRFTSRRRYGLHRERRVRAQPDLLSWHAERD